ncbi:hypothetical protein ACWCPT_29470 [Streptomyces sp. NPDC002308]
MASPPQHSRPEYWIGRDSRVAEVLWWDAQPHRRGLLADVFAALPPKAKVEAVNRRARPEDWGPLLEELAQRYGVQAAAAADASASALDPGGAPVAATLGGRTTRQRTALEEGHPMGHEDWTVDRLHVALPHSASRQQLIQDVNLTPLERLPAVLDGWASAAETLEEARDRIAAVRIAMSAAGRLPEGLETRDVTADILRDAGPRHAGYDCGRDNGPYDGTGTGAGGDDPLRGGPYDGGHHGDGHGAGAA